MAIILSHVLKVAARLEVSCFQQSLPSHDRQGVGMSGHNDRSLRSGVPAARGHAGEELGAAADAVSRNTPPNRILQATENIDQSGEFLKSCEKNNTGHG